MGALLLALAACDGASGTDGPAACDPPPEADPRFFVDRTEEVGVSFQHHMQSDLCHITDTVGGPGVCAFDFDGDLDVDLYFPDREGHASALYRNDGESFVDVAMQAGVAAPGDATGCLAFDYDGDDDLDLFVSTVGQDRLFRNDGGAFADASDALGDAEDGFSTSASAGDIDADGDLDLFVGHLVDLETCPDACYLFPINCTAERSRLYVNQGDGTFDELGAERGLGAIEPTLAALFFDRDADGDVDLYVGNDMGVVFLDRMYDNDGSGHFVDRASELGYSAAGTDTMGVDVGDLNGDGVTDMVTSDFEDRPGRVYRCDASGLPCSFESLPPESTDGVHWAIGMVDFDNDGDLDVFQTGGGVFDPDRVGTPNQLFLNDGKGTLSYFQPGAGSGLGRAAVHRGAAFADLDGDADMDIVVATNGGRPELLYNVGATGHGALVDVGTRGVGARVTATIGARSLTEHALIGGSYLGSSDPRVHFGLGDACEGSFVVESGGSPSSGKLLAGETSTLD